MFDWRFHPYILGLSKAVNLLQNEITAGLSIILLLEPPLIKPGIFQNKVHSKFYLLRFNLLLQREWSWSPEWSCSSPQSISGRTVWGKQITAKLQMKSYVFIEKWSPIETFISNSKCWKLRLLCSFSFCCCCFGCFFLTVGKHSLMERSITGCICTICILLHTCV